MIKSCNKCYIAKELNEFHILKNGLYGRNSICKSCRSKSQKIKNITFIKEKQCVKCNLIKSNVNFYINKYSNDGLQSYCKECHKIKISESNSKFDKFSNLMLKKFKLKHKNININLTLHDIKRKYDEQRGLCYISEKELTHVCDIKQRTDNVWNMSIYIDDNKKEINYNDFNLVIHLIYTIKELYKATNLDIKSIYQKFIM